MKKQIAILCFITFLASCAPTQTYYWGQYNQAQYQHNKKQTDETMNNLLAVYEDIIKKKDKGTRKEVPPGIYADYGYLLIQKGEIEKGKEMLEKEIAIYPESERIVAYILNKI